MSGLLARADHGVPLRFVSRLPLAQARPRVRRVVPAWSSAGENLLIEGEYLGGSDLRVDFGPASTWAVPLDDHTAFCIVPVNAVGPVSVTRSGLRSNSVPFGSGCSDDPTRVLRVDPANGLSGVFRDTPVLMRLSGPADELSLNSDTCRIEDCCGPVPGRARLSPDGFVVIWRGDRLLEPGLEHFVTLWGARDRRGREITRHDSTFVACTLVRAELSG
jgi:hypothetical protein